MIYQAIRVSRVVIGHIYRKQISRCRSEGNAISHGYIAVMEKNSSVLDKKKAALACFREI